MLPLWLPMLIDIAFAVIKALLASHSPGALSLSGRLIAAQAEAKAGNSGPLRMLITEALALARG